MDIANYIKAELYIKEEDINKDIRIINSFEEHKRNNIFIKDKEDDYKYENEKEIKENCEIKINNNIILFNYFYKFKESGTYEIKYIFKEKMKKIDYMFFDCNSLTNIDLSNFNAQNVTNTSKMFSKCGSLINIDLSNFNSQKVTNMSGMFSDCISLTNIDFFNFSTQNAKYMNALFFACSSLTNIDVSFLILKMF